MDLRDTLEWQRHVAAVRGCLAVVVRPKVGVVALPNLALRIAGTLSISVGLYNRHFPGNNYNTLKKTEALGRSTQRHPRDLKSVVSSASPMDTHTSHERRCQSPGVETSRDSLAREYRR